MFKKPKQYIAGLVILLVLMFQAPAHAFYSPEIAKRLFVIKENIIQSQAQHGTGTLTSIVESLIEQDQIRRNLGQSTGLSGHAEAARKEVLNDVLHEIYERPLDGLMSIFNYLPSTKTVISNCLRDDIWTLEAVKNEVVQEMIKAYMSGDIENGSILKEDYHYLVDNIEFLKKYGGGNPKDRVFPPGIDEPMSVNQYLFGSESERNYYIFSFPEKNGCPQGDFEQGWNQVINSWETLKMLSSGGGSDWNWDNIVNAAKVRSKQRAAQWAAANQISLTLAGEEGAIQQSLINDGGLDRMEGQISTQAQIFEDIVVGPLTPLFSRSLWKDISEAGDALDANCAYYYPEDNSFRPCSEEEIEDKLICKKGTEAEKAEIRCDRLRDIEGSKSASLKFKQLELEAKQRQSTLESAELAFKYSVSLNSVAEANIINLNDQLSDINGQIKRSIEAVGAGAGPGLPSVHNHLTKFVARHCVNRQ